VAWHLTDPSASAPLERTFQPALSKTPAGAPIEAEHLMVDAVCAECHADIAEQHERSMHRMSSFNNPAYRFSIDDTRAALLARDGNVGAARLCATCHDQVPLFSGRFDNPDYDPNKDPGSRVGITCLGCHAITAINSPRGNGDYSIADPPRYPFAFSENALLEFVNHICWASRRRRTRSAWKSCVEPLAWTSLVSGKVAICKGSFMRPCVRGYPR
jgi:hypothetical protein